MGCHRSHCRFTFGRGLGSGGGGERRHLYALRVGFDDWIKVWIEGKEVFSGRHEKGFTEDSARVELPAGDVSVLVKLSNFNNFQWRLWAFALRVNIADGK